MTHELGLRPGPGAAGERQARHATLDPGEHLGLGVDERVEEFARLLLQEDWEDLQSPGQRWLHRQYEVVVPLVLPAALRSVEYGVPIDPSSLAALRRAAESCAEDPDSDAAVVLRGAFPALRVFARVMRALSQEHSARGLVAMSRASLVAHELGICWAEAWMRRRSALAAAAHAPPVAGATEAEGAADELELVARGPSLEDSDERVLELAARGLSTDQIAEEMAYSRQAVAWRLGRLMKTWRAPNRTALVSFAFARGWLAARGARRREASRSGHGQG